MTKQEIIRGPEELMPSYRQKLIRMIILGKYQKARDINFTLFGDRWFVEFMYEGTVTYFNHRYHYGRGCIWYASDIEDYTEDDDRMIHLEYKTKRFKQK